MPQCECTHRVRLIRAVFVVCVCVSAQLEPNGRVGPKPPAAPPPSSVGGQPPPRPSPKGQLPEPDYEVIEFGAQQQFANASNASPTPSYAGEPTEECLRVCVCRMAFFVWLSECSESFCVRNGMSKALSLLIGFAGVGQPSPKCELCGSLQPKYRCELCNNRLLCASCDDMYHRHPKRKTHLRKVSGVYVRCMCVCV